MDGPLKPLAPQPLPVPVLLSQNEAVPLSVLEFDLLVKKLQILAGKREWTWRKCILSGKKLEIFKQNVLVDCYYTQHCNVKDISSDGTTYKFLEHGQQKMVIYFTSHTLRDRFLNVFDASTTTMYWAKPPSSILDDLVAVATSIVETATASTPVSMKITSVPITNDLTTNSILSYLDEVVALYDSLPVFGTPIGLYNYVLALEADYMANPLTPPELVKQVLRVYAPDALTLQLNCSQCPHCGKAFKKATVMNLHVGGKTLICDQCSNYTHYQTFKLGEMLRQEKSFTFKTGIPFFQTQREMALPDIPRDGRANTYMQRLWRIIYDDECTTHHMVPHKAKVALEERMMPILNRHDLVQLIYRYISFISQISAHINFWKHPTVIAASVHRYNKFKYLTTLPKVPALAATLDIQLVSHAHQMTTQEPVLPIDMGSDNVKVRLGDTAYLWGEHFNEAYTSYALDVDEWVKTKPGNEEVQRRALRKKWTRYCRLPSFDCRYVGVEEAFPVAALPHMGLSTDNLSSTIGISVIGAHESDSQIYRGKMQQCLVENPCCMYTYRYNQEERSFFEKILAPGWKNI